MPSSYPTTPPIVDDFASLALVASFPLSLVAAYGLLSYRYYSSLLRRIRDAPTVRVSDLRSLLSDRSTGRLVFVRGQVHPESIGPAPNNDGVLVSPASGQKAVILEQTQIFTYVKYECMGKFMYAWNKQGPSSWKSVPFVIAEGGQWPPSDYVRVILDGATHYHLPLTTVFHHRRNLKPPTTITHDLHPVKLSVKLADMPGSKKKKRKKGKGKGKEKKNLVVMTCRGHQYPVAVEDKERILPVGMEITALGICRTRTRDGALEIQSCPEFPNFLSNRTKYEIEADLTNFTNFQYWMGILLGTFSVGVWGCASIRHIMMARPC